MMAAARRRSRGAAWRLQATVVDLLPSSSFFVSFFKLGLFSGDRPGPVVAGPARRGAQRPQPAAAGGVGAALLRGVLQGPARLLADVPARVPLVQLPPHELVLVVPVVAAPVCVRNRRISESDEK
jgi:hypothetical protein